MDLAVEVYRLSKLLPKDETYRLVGQMTRAAVSIPANIAEGNARGTLKDYSNFVSIAKGSAMELETYLLLVIRLGYLTEPHVKPSLQLITEISKMLTALRSHLLQS
jgi:four helix bundle protein